MKLQILLSTQNQKDYSLLEKMNIHSDTLVINQGMSFSEQYLINDSYTVRWINCPEKGIGLSRNTALQRAEADIYLFADDDIVYADTYYEIILQEFESHPEYDIIIFNLISSNSKRPEFINKRGHGIHFFNCLRYGAFRIAIRKTSYQKSRVSMSQLFGGGSRFGSGEDSLFLIDCLRKNLRIYASDKIIGTVSHETSSWFSGYSHKFFYDKGALFAAMSAPFSYLLCLQFCMRHPEMLTELSTLRALKIMCQGARDYKRNIEI